MHIFEYDYPTLLKILILHFNRVMVFCQTDEHLYAGQTSTAWNYGVVYHKQQITTTGERK